ncbi:MAG: hypothetical protein AB1656_05350 [Candidatus Omnitrophota bacterium]
MTIFALAANSQEKAIEKVFDFVENKDQTEWLNLERSLVALDAEDENQSVVKMRPAVMRTGDPKIGVVMGAALYMKAQPVAGKGNYGVFGQRIVQIPNRKYVQFQGGAEILNGAQYPVDFHLLVETRKSANSPWQAEAAFPARGLDPNRAVSPGSCWFMEDLTQYAGQEVRLSLVLSIEPSYTKVGAAERWEPSEIAANVFMAELMSSKFKVNLYAPTDDVDAMQPNPLQGKSAQRNPKQDAVAPETVYAVTYPAYLTTVLDGSQTTAGYLANPSDFPICSEQIPAYTYGGVQYPAHFVSYLAALRWNYHTDHGAPGYNDANGNSEPAVYAGCGRVIDFVNNSSYNMYNASASTIQNSLVKNGACEAISVLTPSGDRTRNFDDHWVGISSILYHALSDNKKALHAFYNGEDHFQYWNDISWVTNNHNGSPHWSVNTSIGYARSTEDSGANFGRTFTKMPSFGSEYKVISYEMDEDELVMGRQGSYGCGDPSIVPVGAYYYMIYSTRGVLKQNGAPALYVVGSTIPVQSCSGYDYGECGNLVHSNLSAARALQSSVFSSSYGMNNNPWKKYKRVSSTWSDSANWTEDGIGGAFSFIWNADSTYTDQPTNVDKWRTNPKVSFNSWTNCYILIAQGGITQDRYGFYIHSSSNPVDWDDGLLITAIDSNFYNNNPKSNYPSLIGSGGRDYETDEWNMLYYTQVNPSDSSKKDLKRMYLELD